MSRDTAKKVLRIEAEAILRLEGRLDDSFDRAIELILQCRGRVVATGMGKSGLICRKIAATLASTGTPALFMHPAEALHGDLGMLAEGDLVLALSNSGETEELLRLVPLLKRLGVSMIALVGKAGSSLSRHALVSLDVGVDQEACPLGLAPTASTTAAVALGDALALVVCERRGFRAEDFARLHPAGGLGKRFAQVSDLMRTGDRIPQVSTSSSMSAVIYEMSRKGLGITSVIDDRGRLAGVISDGDLRRLLERDQEKILARTAGQNMTANPISIQEDELAGAALRLLEQRKITCLMVTNAGGDLTGVLHLHDLWGIDLF